MDYLTGLWGRNLSRLDCVLCSGTQKAESSWPTFWALLWKLWGRISFWIYSGCWQNAVFVLLRLKPLFSFCQPGTTLYGFVVFTNGTGNASHVFNVSTFTWCHSQRKLAAFKAGVPNLQDLMSYDLRWSWCNNNNNNRTKVHNKCNALETSRNHSPPPSPWKNCLGDCCFKEPIWLDWAYQIRYLLINSKPTKLN